MDPPDPRAAICYPSLSSKLGHMDSRPVCSNTWALFIVFRYTFCSYARLSLIFMRALLSGIEDSHW